MSYGSVWCSGGRGRYASGNWSATAVSIATYAGQALDTFYVTESDGSLPSPTRTSEAVAALCDAAAGVDSS